MSSDDRQTSAPPVVAAADPLALVQAAPPRLVEPEMLVEGLRQLQQRIPEFTQLSVQEKRSHARFRRGTHPQDAYMRPHYENMRRAYLRTQRFRKRTKKEAPAAE